MIPFLFLLLFLLNQTTTSNFLQNTLPLHIFADLREKQQNEENPLRFPEDTEYFENEEQPGIHYLTYFEK